MRITSILLCLVCLLGCSLKTKWRDTTSQDRPEEQAQVDARECADISGYANLDRNSTDVEFVAFKTRLDACMGGRGWELIRDDS